MKKIILIISLILTTNNFSYSQLPNSYPFKTHLGEDGFLYVTGNELDTVDNNYDIYVAKYSNNSRIWFLKYNNPYGYDRGMDITLDNQGFPVLTGYLFNQNSNSNDIIIIKLNVNNGAVIWSKQYKNGEEDKGLGIAVDENNNVFVSGYVTNEFLNKDFITLKYSSVVGNFLWKNQYNNPEFNSDDVATDILTDNQYVYAVGYTDGVKYLRDVMMLTYDQNNPVPTDTLIYRKAYTNETPTAFVITQDNFNILAKSRASVTCITDNAFNPHLGTDFLTLTLGGDYFMTLRWAKIFNGSGNSEDVPTAITADKLGNIYVTGYSNRNFGSNYDFATIKYTKQTGGYGWTQQVEYFDYNQTQGVDKASSIKSWQNQVYVSGACDNAPNGYKIISYLQSPTGVDPSWESTFYPEFLDNNRSINEMNKAATMEVDTTTGKVWLIAMAWNETDQFLAMRTFDKDGNILGTVENTERNKEQLESDNPELNEVNTSTQFELKQNYPNPFNPVTVIHYSVPSNVRGQISNVKLIIYNSIGQEVATLVNESKPSGNYSVKFDVSNLSSGIYFYKLESGEFRDIKRMILLK